MSHLPTDPERTSLVTDTSDFRGKGSGPESSTSGHSNSTSSVIACFPIKHRVRAQGIRPAKAGVDLRRQNCPVLRQKHVDLVSKRRVEARQHVGQIRKGIDFVGDARGDDGVEGGEIFARVLVACK